MHDAGTRDAKQMPCLDHLEELRWRLIWSGAAVALGTVVGIFATIRLDLIDVLTAPLFSIIDGLARTDPGVVTVLVSERLFFGLAFELPVVLLVLTFLGLVSTRSLRSRRRHAIVVIAALAAFLTPTDVVSVTLMLMVPLVVLYELGIVLSAAVERRRGGPSGTAAADEGSVPLLGAIALATYGFRTPRENHAHS